MKNRTARRAFGWAGGKNRDGAPGDREQQLRCPGARGRDPARDAPARAVRGVGIAPRRSGACEHARHDGWNSVRGEETLQWTDRIAKLCLMALSTIPGTSEPLGTLGLDWQSPIDAAARVPASEESAPSPPLEVTGLPGRSSAKCIFLGFPKEEFLTKWCSLKMHFQYDDTCDRQSTSTPQA